MELGLLLVFLVALGDCLQDLRELYVLLDCLNLDVPELLLQLGLVKVRFHLFLLRHLTLW